MGNWTGVVIIVAMFGVVALMGYFRIAPTEPEAWHVDPADPALRDGADGTLIRADADLKSPVFDETPEALLAKLDMVAMETPRTRRLAGGVEEGRITYMTRSLIFGFPDFTTVTTEPSDPGARVVAFGRQRFGRSDLGVNRERLEGWLAALGAPQG